MMRGVIAGLLAFALSGCVSTIAMECVQDPATGSMKCVQTGGVVRG